MQTRHLVLPALLCASGIASRASAQFPPERTKNLQVLPKDISIDALIDMMSGFTRALGVRCTYCHVGKPTDPISTYDFAADDKPEKVKARAMLQMVSAINSVYLAKLTARREPSIVVGCATCHHGVAEPRPLQQVLVTAYDAGGADSAEATYRALRTRYYGAAAYDFGEVALADVGDSLHARKRQTDAIRFYLLNTQFSPTSGFALRKAASAYLVAADTAAAIASLERALVINANDQQAKTLLDALRRKP